MWPLFSLQPSINRTDGIKRIGYFNDSIDKWPIAFEYEYGIKWFNMRLRKGIMKEPCAVRQLDHVSTYN